jgi:uncharacterized protein (DUF302 family)
MRCFLIKELPLAFDTVLKKLPYVLRRHGFELLGKVQIDKEIRQYLGVDSKRSALFIISNLQLAYKTLLRDERSALLQFLPLFFYEKNGGTSFTTFRPTQLFPILQSNYRDDEANVIEKRLMEILDTFCRKSSAGKSKKNLPSDSLIRTSA